MIKYLRESMPVMNKQRIEQFFYDEMEDIMYDPMADESPDIENGFLEEEQSTNLFDFVKDLLEHVSQYKTIEEGFRECVNEAFPFSLQYKLDTISNMAGDLYYYDDIENRDAIEEDMACNPENYVDMFDKVLRERGAELFETMFINWGAEAQFKQLKQDIADRAANRPTDDDIANSYDFGF